MISETKKIIFSALPYSHGDLHCGRILGSTLPADFLKRYFLLKNKKVVHYSGSDMFGELIYLKALDLQKNPNEIALSYHENFLKDFDFLNISFDKYLKTNSFEHIEFVNKFFDEQLCPYLDKVLNYSFFCNYCRRFLSMRGIFTKCFYCKETISDDVCEKCWNHFKITKDSIANCKNCERILEVKEVQNFRFPIVLTQQQRNKIIQSCPTKYLKKLFNKGILDGRDILRYSPYGIAWTNSEIKNTIIYVWIEALLSYLQLEASDSNNNLERFFFFGKDNFHFHAEILHKLYFLSRSPESIQKFNSKLIIRNFLNCNNKKLSSSKFNEKELFFIKDLKKIVPSDTIRFYLLEKDLLNRDSNYSFKELINFHNKIYCNKFINYFHRIQKCSPKSILFKKTKLMLDFQNKLDISFELSNLNKTYKLFIKIIDLGNSLLDKYIKNKNIRTLNSSIKLIINSLDYFEIIMPNFFSEIKDKIKVTDTQISLNLENISRFKKIEFFN